MAGIAIILDLLKKNPSFSTQALHSSGLFSASVAASAAAVSVAAGRPFASRFLFGDGGIPVAFSDAGAEWTGDYLSNLRSAAENIFQRDSIKYSTKEYPLELKPLFSAFRLKSLAVTSLRSFAIHYLPLLEPRANLEEDDDDFLQDAPEDEHHVDLVVPFKKSVKTILRETSVSTTRRILERLAVHYVSQRMAWKLLKDVPRSAKRKATRGMPTLVFFCNVSRTTFRGHLLAVTASWLVEVGIEIYRYFSKLTKNKEGEVDKVDRAEQTRLLAMKVSLTTVKCGSSLVFASIGGGIGAALFNPSIGQWLGCAAGDYAGPEIVKVCLVKVLHLDP